VGIDLDSFDIKYLTELEFAGSQVDFRPTTFSETDRHLDQSAVDAVVSNLDHLDHLISDEIASRPLSPRVQGLIGDTDTSASFIIRARSSPTRIIVEEILKPAAILEIQRKVEDGLLVPRY
jgi:hypothetical protein